MNLHKKVLALLITTLLLPAGALAQDIEIIRPATANGHTEAVNTLDILAPYAGTLLPFDLSSGDAVQQGETLFTLDTHKMYAPYSGVITLLSAPGELANDATLRYGMLASLQPENRFRIEATTRGAYNKKENKDVHLGETLYFKGTSDSDIKGECRIISASGNAYVAEIVKGDYEIGKRVKLYRDSNRSSDSCVGEGGITRAPEIPLHGTGRLLRWAVEDGQHVEKGTLLLETVSADAPANVKTTLIPAPQNGIVGTPSVAAGQQVYKGQLLLTLHDTTALKAVVEVDEVDLSRIGEEAQVTLVFDSYPDQEVPGVVTHISGIGTSKQNATYYAVDISFTTMLDVRLGMSVTATLP